METLLLLIIVVALGYFVPTFVARGHPHFAAIFVVNLFFGRTLIRWVGCLAWALIRPKN